MSELTDRVGELVDAFNRGEDLVALGAIADDFEYVNPPDAIESGTRRGQDGWTTAIGVVFEPYDDVQVEVDDLLDAGPGRVLILGRLVVRGRGSGMRMDRELSYLWTFRDGVATRMEWFWGHEAGLRAAGLASEGRP